MEILVATNNVHKVREFQEIFKSIRNLDILSLLNFPDYEAPEETGKTFQENALIKARDAAKHFKRWAVSDDSGLVVPGLQGRPGVRSRRYAGENATDAENREKLIKEMRNFTDSDRAAHFECCLALCGPNGEEKCFTGIAEGTILTEERGRNGFGYDSLFVKNGYDKTFAEMDETVKNRISHRYKAFEKFLTALEMLVLKTKDKG